MPDINWLLGICDGNVYPTINVLCDCSWCMNFSPAGATFSQVPIGVIQIWI